MKLTLFDKDGLDFPVLESDSVKVVFPYHNGKFQKAIDSQFLKSGMIEVQLTDFERKGIPDGEDQTFWAVVTRQNTKFTFRFSKAMNVRTEEGKKVIE